MNDKVLLISPLPPPYGGIASWTVNILKRLSSCSFIVHLNSAMKFRSITSKSQLSRLFFGVVNFFILLYKYLIKLIVLRPKYVYLTSSASWSVYENYFFILLARAFRIECIIHFRFGRIPELMKLKNWEWKMLVKIMNKCQSIIVLDDKSYTSLVSNPLILPVIYKIPNPVSNELESIAIKNKETTRKTNDYYLFVGHVIKEKGVFELLNGFLESKSEKKLIIIGPVEDNIKRQIDFFLTTNDLSRKVFLLGTKNKPEIIRLMMSAEALILPSYTEGFPNVILEAMACGCPVLASNVGAISEMLNFKSLESLNTAAGICFTERSSIAVAQSIVLLEKKQSLKYLFSKNGINRVLLNYTLDLVLPQYKKAIFKL